MTVQVTSIALPKRPEPVSATVLPLKLKAGDQFEYNARLLQVESLHIALHNKVKIYYQTVGKPVVERGSIAVDMDEPIVIGLQCAAGSDEQVRDAAANWNALMACPNMIIAGTSPIEIIITNRGLAQAVLRFIAEREANGHSRSSVTKSDIAEKQGAIQRSNEPTDGGAGEPATAGTQRTEGLHSSDS